LFLQREGAEDILDFWLDVQQHENLCRAYFKDVRKSGRTIREDWPEYWEYARRRGSTYGTVVGGQPGAKRSTASTAEMAAEMQEKRGTTERSTTPDPRLVASPATAVGTDLEHALSSATPAQPRPSTPFSLGKRTPTFFSRRTSRAPTIIPRSSPISRANLVESAERIFLRYLSPAGTSPGGGESHEIYLPPALRLHSFPLSNATGSAADQAAIAQVPDMFHAQKDYCFRAMEQDAFPRFLRSKAFGNLTPMSALVRLVAGLISLWVGLATAFALVFLDVKPKSVRFYVRIFLISVVSIRGLLIIVSQAVHPLYLRTALPHFASVRTRSYPRISWAERNYSIPHPAHPRTLCSKTTDWSLYLGFDPCSCWSNSAYAALLGCSGAQTLVSIGECTDVAEVVR
jgi:ABC-type glycerol-3-phosphate transport system permease component